MRSAGFFQEDREIGYANARGRQTHVDLRPNVNPKLLLQRMEDAIQV